MQSRWLLLIVILAGFRGGETLASNCLVRIVSAAACPVSLGFPFDLHAVSVLSPSDVFVRPNGRVPNSGHDFAPGINPDFQTLDGIQTPGWCIQPRLGTTGHGFLPLGLMNTTATVRPPDGQSRVLGLVSEGQHATLVSWNPWTDQRTHLFSLDNGEVPRLSEGRPLVYWTTHQFGNDVLWLSSPAGEPFPALKLDIASIYGVRVARRADWAIILTSRGTFQANLVTGDYQLLNETPSYQSAMSADGRFIALVTTVDNFVVSTPDEASGPSDFQNIVRVFDTRTATEIHSIPVRTPVKALEFLHSPEKPALLGIAAAHEAEVWDVSGPARAVKRQTIKNRFQVSVERAVWLVDGVDYWLVQAFVGGQLLGWNKNLHLVGAAVTGEQWLTALDAMADVNQIFVASYGGGKVFFNSFPKRPPSADDHIVLADLGWAVERKIEREVVTVDLTKAP
jgi:hypothetical protein